MIDTLFFFIALILFILLGLFIATCKAILDSYHEQYEGESRIE